METSEIQDRVIESYLTEGAWRGVVLETHRIDALGAGQAQPRSAKLGTSATWAAAMAMLAPDDRVGRAAMEAAAEYAFVLPQRAANLNVDVRTFVWRPAYAVGAGLAILQRGMPFEALAEASAEVALAIALSVASRDAESQRTRELVEMLTRPARNFCGSTMREIDHEIARQERRQRNRRSGR